MEDNLIEKLHYHIISWANKKWLRLAVKDIWVFFNSLSLSNGFVFWPMRSHSCQTEVMLSESESRADIASCKLIYSMCVCVCVDGADGESQAAATHGFLAQGDVAGTSSLYKYAPGEFQ